MIKGLAPGSILQLMHVKRRFRRIKKGRFLEFGSGEGQLSKILLDLGWEGVGVDMNPESCQRNSKLNEQFCKNGRYRVICGNVVNQNFQSSFDLIISSMVIEHIPDQKLLELFKQIKNLLSDSGFIATLVPSGMKFWSVEDDIAGHVKRYEAKDIEELALKTSMNVRSIKGLTFPISNLLLPISSYLIKKQEGWKLDLDIEEKTIKSSSRDVVGKTRFPEALNVILNEVFMWPLYILQRVFTNSKQNMVIYFELTKTKI